MTTTALTPPTPNLVLSDRLSLTGLLTADALIRRKGGKGLTVTKAPIEYDRMGDYMGKAAVAAAAKEGRPVQETVEPLHENSRWHVVLFRWPGGGKASSGP